MLRDKEKTLCNRNDEMNGVDQENKHVADEDEVELKVLYKYGKFDEHTERCFTHNELFFSSPGGFNDPFDSKLLLTCEGEAYRIEKYLCKQYEGRYSALSKNEIRRRVQRLSAEKGGGDIVLKEAVEATRDLLRKTLGVCCFTEKRDDILMWAHYAGQHTGFCLEFDVDNEFFRRAAKVEYEASLPRINVLSLADPPEGKAAKKLLIKARDWEYEQEWRIVDFGKFEEIQTFPAEALRGVILGCRASPEDKKNVFRWCSERKHGPALYQAKEKQEEFGLDIVRIDY